MNTETAKSKILIRFMWYAYKKASQRKIQPEGRTWTLDNSLKGYCEFLHDLGYKQDRIERIEIDLRKYECKV